MNNLFDGCGEMFQSLFDPHDTMPVINPASGLPMVGHSTAGVDVGGNLYGMDDSTWSWGGGFLDD